MTIFFHHVGEIGAASDFPRTVIHRDGSLVYRSFSEVEPYLELSPNAVEHLREELRQAGALDGFQVWGIPSGGERTLGSLGVDDHMLLLPTDRLGSTFRYGGKVIARVPRPAHKLSRFLWESERFPIVFFMTGAEINYPWDEFKAGLGYKLNWQVRGKAFPVTPGRLAQSRFKTEASLLEAIFGAFVKGLDVSQRSDYDEDILSILEDKYLIVTEKTSLILARIGQGDFRENVLRNFGGRCAVTGCRVSEALRASHIKPWRSSTNLERLDVNNGLLLIASLDAVFDRYLITFDSHGKIRRSRLLAQSDAELLSARGGMRQIMTARQEVYMAEHRRVFESLESRR